MTLDQPIPLTWRTRTRNALNRAGIHTLSDLTLTSAETLFKAQGIGKSGLKYVRKRLTEQGLDLCSQPLLAQQMDHVVVASLKSPVSSLDYYPGVYVIRLQDFAKIGHTSCAWRRVCSLQTGVPFDVELVGFIPCGLLQAKRLEKELHERFDAIKARGEWFHWREPLIEFVASLPWPVAA